MTRSLRPQIVALTLLALLTGAGPSIAAVATVTSPPGSSNTPGGIALDSQGRIYSADFGGTQLFRIELDGTVTVLADGFRTPSGNAFDSNGVLFQSNYRDPAAPGPNDTISRVTQSGRVTTFASGLSGPVGIAPAEDGSLFVVQCDANNVVRITPDGQSTVFASGPLFVCPNGITFDDRGILFVVNFNSGDVVRIAPDGTVRAFGRSPGGGSGHITYVSGGLYMTDRVGHQIHRFDVKSGRLTDSFGSGSPGNSDGPNAQATFNQPNGIARNAEGSALFTNGAGHFIRRIDLDLKRPKKPKRFRVRVDGADEVRLTWKHPSRNKEGFVIEARRDREDFEEAGTASSTATGAVIGGLEAATTYTFRVRAFNGTASSKASRKVEVTTDP